MPATSSDYRGLIDSYSARRQSLISRSQAQLETLWRRVNPYDGQSVKEFAEQASLISMASQQHIALLSSTTQLNAVKLMGAGEIDFAPDIPEEVRLFSPTERYEYAKPVKRRTSAGYSERLSNAEVFNRPARTYRYLRSVGKDESDALDDSLQRVKIAIETNVVLAEREAENQVVTEISKKLKATGWRRILHPERSEGGCCGLCVAAADRTYTVKELRAIHHDCKCQILPVFDGQDPGLDLNAEDLSNLYDAAGSTAGQELKKLRFQIEQHGELGPMLVSPKGVKIPYFSAEAPELSVAA